MTVRFRVLILLLFSLILLSVSIFVGDTAVGKVTLFLFGMASGYLFQVLTCEQHARTRTKSV